MMSDGNQMMMREVVAVPAAEAQRIRTLGLQNTADTAIDMHADALSQALTAFLNARADGTEISERNLSSTYTKSAAYLRSIALFQQHNTKARALSAVARWFTPETPTLDLGCCAGFTGLSLRLNGWTNVNFADFEGLGLDFVRHTCMAKGWAAQVYPYEPTDQAAGGMVAHDLVLAFDVIEHTPNQLGFIEWLRRLGKYAAVTWPTVNWHPPLYQPIDCWMDQDAMMWVIERRFKVLESWFQDSRRFVLFETGK